MPINAKKKKPKHVVAWVREQLGMTQFEFARAIDSSQPTIQAIELGRLPLSERFAYAISGITGIRAKWLLANKLGSRLPDPAVVREHYERWKDGDEFSGGYMAHLLPRMLLFRHYVFMRAVVHELGYSGFKATGCDRILIDATSDLLEKISDKRLAKRIYQEARATAVDSEEVFKLLLADVTEMRRAVRENRARNKAAEEMYPLKPRVTSQWDAKGRFLGHFDFAGTQLEDQAALKPGIVKRIYPDGRGVSYFDTEGRLVTSRDSKAWSKPS